MPGHLPSDMQSELVSDVPVHLASDAVSDSSSELPNEYPNDTVSDLPIELPNDLSSRLPTELPSRILMRPSDWVWRRFRWWFERGNRESVVPCRDCGNRQGHESL